MANVVQPVYGPDFGQMFQQGLQTYRGIKQMRQEDIDRDIKDKDRFDREAAQFSQTARGKTTGEKVALINERIAGLKKRGITTEASERLLELYTPGSFGPQRPGDAEQSVADADAMLERRYQEGLQKGYIKGPEMAKEKTRPATEEEKAAYGITDSEPYQITPTGTISRIPGKSSGQTINVTTGGQPPVDKTGVIPKGYALRRDDAGDFEMYKIKGGPAAEQAAENIKKETLQKETTGRTANIVKEDITRLSSLIENADWYNPVTGITGGLASNIAGSARKDAEGLKTTIGANIGFDRLQAMRDASKTGGALGAISEREMKQLESVMGSIGLDQSDEQLMHNLSRLNKAYAAIIEKANSYPNASQFGFGAVAQPVANRESLNAVNQQAPQALLDRYQ